VRERQALSLSTTLPLSTSLPHLEAFVTTGNFNVCQST
jgi:hypothetical protein